MLLLYLFIFTNLFDLCDSNLKEILGLYNHEKDLQKYQLVFSHSETYLPLVRHVIFIFISRRALAREGDYEMMPVCACVRACVCACVN